MKMTQTTKQLYKISSYFFFLLFASFRNTGAALSGNLLLKLFVPFIVSIVLSAS